MGGCENVWETISWHNSSLEQATTENLGPKESQWNYLYDTYVRFSYLALKIRILVENIILLAFCTKITMFLTFLHIEAFLVPKLCRIVKINSQLNCKRTNNQTKNASVCIIQQKWGFWFKMGTKLYFRPKSWFSRQDMKIAGRFRIDCFIASLLVPNSLS
jgi:hypothetical protein